jgi:hypothetical protein
VALNNLKKTSKIRREPFKALGPVLPLGGTKKELKTEIPDHKKTPQIKGYLSE